MLVNLNGVRTRFAGIDDMHAGVRLTGPVTDLTAALTLSGDGIRGAAGSSWDVSHVDLATTVRKTNAIEVTGTRLELTRGKDVARVYAERVRVSGEHLAVSGARVEGLGQPLEIAFTKDGEIIHVTAHSTGIDVARVGKLAGMTSDLRHGNAGLDADVTLAPHHTRGRVSLHAAELSVSSIERGVVELDASVDDRKVAVVLDAKLGSAGDVHIATNEAELGGDPMNPASWKRVRGRIDVNSAIDLCKLSSTLPPDRMPLNELCGTVEAHGYVARTSTEGLPDVDLSLVTTGLVLAGKEAPRPTEGAQVSTMPWRIAGVDVALAVRIDPKSGDANVNTKLFDSHGDLVTLDAKTKIEGAIAQSGAAGNGWQSLPIEAHVAMPERPVSTLPAVLGLRHTQGTLEFTGAARGSALDPHVDFTAHARGVHEAAADTTLALGYDGHAANVSVHTVARKGGALDVTAKLVAEAKAMLAAKEPLNAAWTATARVEAKEFPIESLDEVIGPRVRGKLDLVAELRDLHQNAVLTVKGSVQDPRIAGVKYRGITIDARAATGGLDAHARLDQMEGFAEVSATSGLTWGAALAPQLDPAHAIDARVSAKNFRASAAQPFMQSVVDELDGVLDGDIALHGAGGKDKPTVEGSLSFRDGLVHAAALGDDLRNVRFRVAAAKGGEVRVDDVYAKGTEGEVKARALLHLDGLGWRDASANVDIAQSGAMGISLQGEPLGRIWGSVAVKATNDAAAQRVTLDVSVPRLNVKLPNASTNNVQKLGEQRADIHIGHYLRENSFIRLARNAGDVKENASPAKQASTATTVLTVDLGDITIVRGNNVNVRVGGKPKVEIGEHTRLTGQLVVKEGKLDVQGHQFEIERGTVTFNGEDPPNPQVLVTATWVAADKTKVFAEFVGPAKGGKLTLRSEPALPRDEVLSLILFGTTDGMSPQPSSASSANQSSGAKAAGAAAGLGGGFVAQGVTEAIDDLAGVRAQARIDTTSSANPRPEIDIQVARDVSVRAAHVIGEPPPTEPDMNFVTVSWRLGRGWSLETTVGDRGRSEVDAIWTHRY